MSPRRTPNLLFLGCARRVLLSNSLGHGGYLLLFLEPITRINQRAHQSIPWVRLVRGALAVSVVKAARARAHVGAIEPVPYTSRQPGLLGSVRWYWMGPMPLMAMIAGSVSVFFTPS